MAEDKLPWNPANKGLQGHPMLKKVTQAYMAGQSARKIATWIHPPVSHHTISKYISTYVLPVLDNAEAIKALLGFNVAKDTNVPAVLKDYTQPGQIDALVQQAIIAAPVLTTRDGRVQAQIDRHVRMTKVIAARANRHSQCLQCGHLESEHPYQGVRPDGSLIECGAYEGIPGADTGLLVGKVKPNGTEYLLDTGLLGEMREHEKQIAIEMGQWQETTGTSSVSVQIVCPQAPDGALPRVSFATSDTIELDPGEVIGTTQRPV